MKKYNKYDALLYAISGGTLDEFITCEGREWNQDDLINIISELDQAIKQYAARWTNNKDVEKAIYDCFGENLLYNYWFKSTERIYPFFF